MSHPGAPTGVSLNATGFLRGKSLESKRHLLEVIKEEGEWFLFLRFYLRMREHRQGAEGENLQADALLSVEPNGRT